MAARVMCLLSATFIVSTGASQELMPLRFSLMVSNSSDFDTLGVVPAVDKVLDIITNDSSILPGYKLQYELLQHQVVFQR